MYYIITMQIGRGNHALLSNHADWQRQSHYIITIHVGMERQSCITQKPSRLAEAIMNYIIAVQIVIGKRTLHNNLQVGMGRQSCITQKPCRLAEAIKHYIMIM